MDFDLVYALLTDYDRFTEIALHMDWAAADVKHVENTEEAQHWVFITAIRFPAGYVQAHAAECFLQAMITHECATEELGENVFARMTAEERMLHLSGFEFEYHYKPEDVGQSLGCYTAEVYAQELEQHCGHSAFAAVFFPLFSAENEMLYIGSHGCTPCWDYLTVSGDTLLMTTMSVCC